MRTLFETLRRRTLNACLGWGIARLDEIKIETISGTGWERLGFSEIIAFEFVHYAEFAVRLDIHENGIYSRGWDKNLRQWVALECSICTPFNLQVCRTHPDRNFEFDLNEEIQYVYKRTAS